jgi:molecular chaperone IbpA
MSQMKTLLDSLNLHKAFDPFTVGFQDFFDDVEYHLKQTSPSYPPYNIKKIDKSKYVIEMAIAGFSKSDIEVTLEGNKLVVKGLTKEEPNEDNYIFKGIANRAFNRTFTLSDRIEIESAQVVNGMLEIWLSNLAATQEAIRKISVK